MSKNLYLIYMLKREKEIALNLAIDEENQNIK